MAGAMMSTIDMHDHYRYVDPPIELDRKSPSQWIDFSARHGSSVKLTTKNINNYTKYPVSNKQKFKVNNKR